MSALSSELSRTTERDASAVPVGADWRRTVPILATVLGTLFILLRRNHSLFYGQQFVVEDLWVLFTDDRLLGARAFLENYNGYYLTLPRIIAFLVGLASPAYAPALYSFALIAVILLTASIFYTSPIFTGWSKALAALAIVMAPNGSEPFMAMTYVIWITALVIPLALYERPDSNSRAALFSIWLAVVGMSSPFLLMASPFLLIKFLKETTRYAASLLAVTCVTGLFQLHPLLSRTGATGTTGSILDRVMIARTYFYSWLTGSQYRMYVITEDANPKRIAAIISAAVILAFACYLWSTRRTAGRAVFYFWGYVALTLMAGCYQLNPNAEHTPFEMGARYFYPAAVLTTVAFITIEQNYARRWITMPALAAFLLAIQIFRVPSIDNLISDRGWNATAECLQSSHDCWSVSNPTGYGTNRIASDTELRSMPNLSDRLQFRSVQRKQ